MKRLFLIAVAVVFSFTACTNKPKDDKVVDETKTETTDTTETTTTEENTMEVSKENTMEVSKENPIVVDKEAKTISILATVNGKYFDEVTRHMAISEGGKIADMALFKTPVTPTDFYNGLLEIGAKAGDNMTAENAATTTTEGSKLNVTLSFGDKKDVDVNEAVLDSNGTPLDIRFSGNMNNSKEFNTGCITCLDSCFVGITSNAAYPLGAVEEQKSVEFKGNKDVLPADGSEVVITYKLAD